MKIKSILILVLLNSFAIYAQEIKVKDNKHIILLFESNIESGIVSNDDYTFEYNADKPDNIGLLKAKKKTAEETSLIVKTLNGTIFNMNISYGQSKDNIIKIMDTLGYNPMKKTNPKKSVPQKVKNTKDVKSTKVTEKSPIKEVVIEDQDQEETAEEVQESLKENDYTVGNLTINDKVNNALECIECQRILNMRKGIKRIVDEKYKIKAQLNNVFYNNNKLYVQINFINDSDLDYNINYIKSYISTGNDNKATSTQYLEKYPIQIYNSNRTIAGGSERKFVFVYDQFTIDNNKAIIFEVNEDNGERNLFLHVPHFLINNPRKLKL